MMWSSSPGRQRLTNSMTLTTERAERSGSGWHQLTTDKLTKTFAKLIQENNFLKKAKFRKIYVFAAILTW